MQKNKGKIYTGTRVHGYTGTFAWDRDNGTICFFFVSKAVAKWPSHQVPKLQMQNEKRAKEGERSKGDILNNCLLNIIIYYIIYILYNIL